MANPVAIGFWLFQVFWLFFCYSSSHGLCYGSLWVFQLISKLILWLKYKQVEAACCALFEPNPYELLSIPRYFGLAWVGLHKLSSISNHQSWAINTDVIFYTNLGSKSSKNVDFDTIINFELDWFQWFWNGVVYHTVGHIWISKINWLE